MRLDFKRPVKLDGHTYLKGIHEVPDRLDGHWYLLALIGNRDVLMLEAPKPKMAAQPPKKEAEAVLPEPVVVAVDESAPEAPVEQPKKGSKKKKKG